MVGQSHLDNYVSLAEREAKAKSITKEGHNKKLRVKQERFLVTASCLCKNLEGAGFPFQVKTIEDGVA